MTTPPAGRTASIAARLPGRLRQLAAHLPGSLAPPVAPGAITPRIAIVGSGYGGLAMACRLRQAGIDTFTIYEKATSVGGTWRDNSYPGAACDVPSHLYSLSFAPNANWSRKFPQQPEILAYLDDVADRFGLRPHLRFGAELSEATWDDERQRWDLTFADGATDEADVVVAATGQLNRPQIPPIEGLDAFEGVAFHSARWDHDHDLADRRVGVVGIGASAIQFVPPVAEQASHVTLFQRSANYVGPKKDPVFSERTKAMMAAVPAVRLLYRWSIWARFEARWVVFRRGSRLGRTMEGAFGKALRPLVSDELSAEALLPDTPIGCKRILISDDWYPTLLRPDVRVVTAPVARVERDAIVTADGERHPVDTIVFGTGFASTGFLHPIRVRGRDGRDLHEDWADGAEAHLGITVTGFPNLFLLYGPNTNLGHNSIVFMIERQVAYALTWIRRLVETGAASAEVRPEAQARSNDRITSQLASSVWAESCRSWYKTRTGKITNNWPGPTLTYWWRTLRPHPDEFIVAPPRPDAAERPRAAAHSGGDGSPG
jgi:cation diffusion facilitator CzcD-associated flavoprotein CzcO